MTVELYRTYGLDRYMGQFCDLLQCKPEEVRVIQTPANCNPFLANRYFTSYRNTKVPKSPRPICIEVQGFGDEPPVYRDGATIGINVFETPDGIRYLHIFLPTPGHTRPLTPFFIYRGGSKDCNRLLRIVRYHKKLSEESPVKNINPVLDPQVYDDVIKNSIGFIAKQRRLREYGVKASRGILFTGPPGNGKTMLCKHIKELCNQKSIEYGTITASELEDAFAHNHMDYTLNRYTVTFFDDIDASYFDRQRNGKMTGSILSAMDGFCETSNATVRIFTTNEKVDNLDSAFTRPGRIDMRVEFNKPTPELRRKLIISWHPEVVDNIDVEALVASTDDISFAELENVKTTLVSEFLDSGKWDMDCVLKNLSFHAKKDSDEFGFAGIAKRSQDKKETPEERKKKPLVARDKNGNPVKPKLGKWYVLDLDNVVHQFDRQEDADEYSNKLNKKLNRKDEPEK